MKTRISCFLLLLLSLTATIGLRAQDSRTSLAGWSLVDVEQGEVMGECHTIMQGDTENFYPSVGVLSCEVYQTSNTGNSQSCMTPDGGTSASCTTDPLPTAQGSSYQTVGHFALWFDQDTFTCPSGFVDDLAYSEDTGAYCGLYFCAYPGHQDDSNPICVSSSPLELFHVTSEPPFTPITISPDGAQIFSGQTQPYTSNDCPHVTWSVAGGGTITQSQGNSCGGEYTAPKISGSQSGESVTITAQNQLNTADITSVTATIISGAVLINSPTALRMNQGQMQTFTATVDGCTTNCVKWSALLGKIDMTSGVYTAPATVTSQQSDMITAASLSDATQTDSVSITLDPIVISFSPVSPFVAIPNATKQLSVFVSGLDGNSPPACTWSVTPSGVGSFGATNCSSGTYFQPTINAETIVTINVCAQTVPQVCAATPLTLTMVPPVFVTSLGGSWNAGQTNTVSINGSGFGTSPLLTFSIPGITYTLSTVSNTQITATVTIPVEFSPMTLTVTVTAVTAGIAVSGNANVNTSADNLSISAVAPATVTLEETQMQQFTGGVATCKSPGGFTCTAPAPTWSISSTTLSNPGTITQGGLYTAPSTGVVGAAQVSGKVCVGTTCSTFTINLSPIGIAVNPSGTTLNGGGTQTFTATVTNSPTATVTWTPVTMGTLSSTGPNTALYTAPNPITTTVLALVIQACSTLDPARCGSTTVKLQTSDFSIAVTPATQVILAGGSTTYSVNVAPLAGFSGSVILSVSGLPSGATYNFSPATIPGGVGSSTLTVFGNTAAAGASTLTITGTSGSLMHTANPVTLSITDFKLTVGPTSSTAFVGGSTAYTITVSPLNGFTGNIALSAVSSPKGPTTAFSLNTIASGAGSSTMTVSVPAGTTPGTYTLTITGSSGNIIHTATTTLIVPTPDFTISTNDPWFMGQGGTTLPGVVTITPVNGFTGTVSLSLTWNYNPNPVGLTAKFSPQTVVGGGTSTATFTSTAATPATGYYPIITATSGSLTHLWYPVLYVQAAWVDIDYNPVGVRPSGVAGFGPPNTLAMLGEAQHGTGTAQLLWNDTTLGTGWQTVSPPLVPDAYGNVSGTIPSGHYCHSISVELIYVGITSAVYNYVGQGSPYCTLKTTWVQPEGLAGYGGPPGSLVAAGFAVGAPAGTPVVLWWRDVTLNGAWTSTPGVVPSPSNNLWISSIPNVNYSHTYSTALIYDVVTTASDVCVYTGNNNIVWCP